MRHDGIKNIFLKIMTHARFVRDLFICKIFLFYSHFYGFMTHYTHRYKNILGIRTMYRFVLQINQSKCVYYTLYGIL